jgi:hypothetical protein
MHTSSFTMPLSKLAKEQEAATMAEYLARQRPSQDEINHAVDRRSSTTTGPLPREIDAAWTPPPSLAEIAAAFERASQLGPIEEAAAYKALAPLLKRAQAAENWRAAKQGISPAQPAFRFNDRRHDQ